jgi:NADH-quinone oxidoreductase subunit L
MMIENVWIIPLMPLIGFLINGLLGRKLPKALIGGVACGTMAVSFLVSIGCFLHILAMPADNRFFKQNLFLWIGSGDFQCPISFTVDPLSIIMLLVVTGVGFLIHVYSVGYMHEEDSYSRYFAYLNLFVFFMLLLVLGSNFLVMFVGWEGVGLCSYLLIGYYWRKPSAGDAGKKAFVMNRVGDFGFILAIMLIFVSLGTIDFQQTSLFAHTKLEMGGTVVTAITLLLFLGATGKSAQIPLYTWLPDAMEGPTPVSALIHAATMVTAGVYMIARCSMLFMMAPLTMAVVAAVGGATALFAATIGICQNDIKRVLAYSTVSQLGYMFLACGVGAFSAAIFHLMTHAFFKACLFLGSGSVIHGLHGEQDIRKMGGLRTHMPKTHLTFLVSTLAIAGIPPLAGFFSKDEILWKALVDGNPLLWGLGAMAALMTAFYMFRLVYMTFYGPSRVDPHVHPHESPTVMTLPLVVLAGLALIGGFVGIPIIEGGDRIGDFLQPVFATPAMHAGHAVAHVERHSLGMELGMMGLSVLIALTGIVLAFKLYMVRTDLPAKIAERIKPFYDMVFNKYYIDELYDAIIVNPLKEFSNFLWKGFDVVVIDGLVNGTASFFKGLSTQIRVVQNGFVRNYALSFMLGFVLILYLWAK